jgi:two-component system, chemotaxis family, sensor kinase CheA
MGTKEEEFLKRLLATFKIEAEEHLQAIASGVLALEKSGHPADQTEILETVFREAHSLKGAARAVNLGNVEAVCQPLESLLAAVKRQELALSPELFDVIYQAVDILTSQISFSETISTKTDQSRTRELISRLERPLEDRAASQDIRPDTATSRDSKGETGALTGTLPPLPASPSLAAVIPEGDEPRDIPESMKMPEKRAIMETVRIPAAQLDDLLRQAEELISAKQAAGQRAADLRNEVAQFGLWHKEWAKVQSEVRSHGQRHQKPGCLSSQTASGGLSEKLSDFFEWNETFLKSAESNLSQMAKTAEHDGRTISVMVNNLLEDMKRVLMFPFASLLEIFPKLVRDLSREQGKEVDLVIRGGEVEIDKRILQVIKDPLIHLVRNCIDHGLELPELRSQQHKPPQGQIILAISQQDSSKMEILIADDGAGIDAGRVKAAAIKLGLISSEDAAQLTDEKARLLMFRSGISTSPIITNISGRGLGLAIVLEKVEQLGGSISLDSQPGQGTTFRMLLPITLATFRGTMVRVADQLFLVPTVNLERVARVKHDDLKTVENRETISLNGQAVSLVRLEDVLEIPRRAKSNGDAPLLTVMVLSTAERRIAFAVDAVLHEQEVLVNSLGQQLSRVRNIAGAAVLGTGRVVPILNVLDLLKSAVRATGAPVRVEARAEPEEAGRRGILVVEDSITSRTLLKNILESAGYQVKIAVDGLDGLAQLQTEEFDLVVSDVEMPRMNGFELTAKVRADKRLADLPVVLVTALASNEDRARGIDVGASAYIIKSSFDQSNLLEVIRRLV